MKLLTIFLGIAVVCVNHLIVVYIVAIGISLMVTVVEQRKVSLDVIDLSTTKLDLWSHGMKCNDQGVG